VEAWRPGETQNDGRLSREIERRRLRGSGWAKQAVGGRHGGATNNSENASAARQIRGRAKRVVKWIGGESAPASNRRTLSAKNVTRCRVHVKAIAGAKRMSQRRQRCRQERLCYRLFVVLLTCYLKWWQAGVWCMLGGR